MLTVKQRNREYQFLVFDLTRPGIELKSIVTVAEVLSTRSLIGKLDTSARPNTIAVIIDQECHYCYENNNIQCVYCLTKDSLVEYCFPKPFKLLKDERERLELSGNTNYHT